MKSAAKTQGGSVAAARPQTSVKNKNNHVFIAKKLKVFSNQRTESNKASALQKPGGSSKVSFTPNGKRKVAPPGHQKRQEKILGQQLIINKMDT